MSAIVSCRNVEKIYQQGAVEVPALRGVDLEIEQGDFATLAGPSGSGKTTLLNIIGGLDHQTRGDVVVAGQSLAGLSREKLADLRLHQIGFVFQSFNLIPVLSAIENVMFILELQHTPAKQSRARAREVLSEVGLSGLEDRRPARLSGGQQQRVAVARALGPMPAIVLADEPTGSLDSKSADDLITLMSKLNQTSGATFLIATHDPRVMARARRNIEMTDGRITADVRRPATVAAE